MEDYNVIQILDKIKKEIERGAIPLAISEIDSTVLLLNRKIAKANGKRFSELHIVQDLPKNISTETVAMEKDLIETKLKCNEIIRYLNERFPLN